MDAHGRTRLWSLPSNVVRVVAHIFAPAKPEGKSASITYHCDELRARRDTRPKGNVDRH